MSPCDERVRPWVVRRHRFGLCGNVLIILSTLHGRGTAAAAEKQQSLQSLICKYANARVIKIGRLSVAL